MIEIEWEDRLDELETFISQAVVEARKMLFRVGDDIFALSQIMVSRRALDRGTLKKSGSKIILGNSMIIIGYNTPYARINHDGNTEFMESIRMHKRRRHERKTKHGVQIIEAHWVHPHIRRRPARNGTFYLEDAVNEVLSRLDPEDRKLLTVEYVKGDGIND